MKLEDLLEHRAELTARLEVIEAEKAHLVRQLKALEVLLEGVKLPSSDARTTVRVRRASRPNAVLEPPRRRAIPSHAVRVSSRTSLIGAVQDVALKQQGTFDSVQLLKALQSAYPEFQLTETKHISSPLSDLVKRGVLALERKRLGSKPNIYRVAQQR